MNRNNTYVYPTVFTRIRARSLLLVLPALLAAYAVAGAASPALAAGGGGGGTDGTVDVTADSLGTAPGNVVVFTITVHNGSQAGMVTVNDNLPPHTTLLNAPGCTSRNGGSVTQIASASPNGWVSLDGSAPALAVDTERVYWSTGCEPTSFTKAAW